MSGDVLNTQIAEVQQLMAERLRIRGKTLDQQVRKAGRLLPRAVRREATYLAQAQGLTNHPKLSMMIDAGKATAAHARTVEFLRGVDPKGRLKDRVISALGAISLGLIVLFVAVIWFLWNRGII